MSSHDPDQDRHTLIHHQEAVLVRWGRHALQNCLNQGGAAASHRELEVGLEVLLVQHRDLTVDLVRIQVALRVGAAVLNDVPVHVHLQMSQSGGASELLELDKQLHESELDEQMANASHQ